MIVTFNKEALNAAVSPALSAVSTKNTITAIEGICIEANADGSCILSAYDLEKGIRCTLRGNVERAGSYILNGQKLAQIIRSMPSDIRIEVCENHQAKITSEQSEFTLNAMPGEEFPTMPDLRGEVGFTLYSSEMKDMIAKTLYAVAVNEPRPALNGIYFRVQKEMITVVSTDSFRLSVCKKKMNLENDVSAEDLDFSMIVPGKAVQELLKMLSDDDALVKVQTTKKHIVFNMDNICFFSRLIDAEYVQHEKFIPKNPATFVSVECDRLREALERASLVTQDKSSTQSKSYVRFSFEDQLLKVSAKAVNGAAYEEVPVEKEGPDLSIGFNCRYMLDALRVCDTKFIRIAFVSPLVSAVIRADEAKRTEDEEKAIEKKKEKRGVQKEEYTHLVVPLHMTD